MKKNHIAFSELLVPAIFVIPLEPFNSWGGGGTLRIGKSRARESKYFGRRERYIRGGSSYVAQWRGWDSWRNKKKNYKNFMPQVLGVQTLYWVYCKTRSSTALFSIVSKEGLYHPPPLLNLRGVEGWGGVFLMYRSRGLCISRVHVLQWRGEEWGSERIEKGHVPLAARDQHNGFGLTPLRVPKPVLSTQSLSRSPFFLVFFLSFFYFSPAPGPPLRHPLPHWGPACNPPPPPRPLAKTTWGNTVISLAHRYPLGSMDQRCSTPRRAPQPRLS